MTTATQSLALPTAKGPNYAPVRPLQSYVDQGGAPSKPFSEWIKLETGKLERLNLGEWTELALIWQLLNMFINGDQIAVRGHRTGTWTRVPMPTTTTAPVRQQNKLGFYSRVLMSKWVAARTKVKAVAGDDSDQTAGAVRSAQIFADVIEPIVYSEMFRQQEGLGAQAHGTFARYFYYDEQHPDGGYGFEPITEQRTIATEGYGECLECGYAGASAEFEMATGDDSMASGLPDATAGGFAQPTGAGSRAAFNAPYGHDELAEWEQGLEAPHPPEEEGLEENEQQHLAYADRGRPGLPRGISGNDQYAQNYGVQDAVGGNLGSSGISGSNGQSCPNCGSTATEVEPPQEQTIEAVTGVKQYKLGQMRGISVPYTQLRHEISCSAEESPWMRWKRRVRLEEIKAAFPGLKIPPMMGAERDPGLATEEALRRSVAQSGRNGRGAQKGEDQYTNFTQWWLTPMMYNEYVFPEAVETLAGETIPAGAKAIELFPDGMYFAMCEGVDAPLQVRNECHKWHWVTAPYRLQMFSGLGIGINDAMEMQRQWNVTLSLVFEQIRSSSLPGWLYDKDAISPDDVRLLGQPQNNVPVSTQNRENVTNLEQLVKQMPPGPIPAHIPWYITQLDANMQTAAGALVNEGVPGVDTKTLGGAELMNASANQHNAPEYALKGDADVRSMAVLFELAKKHYVEPRYLPLSGKRGKQDGVWLSAADFANGQIRWEAVRNSWMPTTMADKQRAIQEMLLAAGGLPVFLQLMAMKPDVAAEFMEIYGVDADVFADEYAATTILCRQRLDQVMDAAKEAEPILQQAQQMAAIMPLTTIDPATGAVMQADPTEMLAQQIVDGLQPPMCPEEPGHQFALTWYRQALIDDEVKNAGPLPQMCVRLIVRKTLEMMMLEAQVMSQFAAMSQPPQGEGEGAGGKSQKSDKKKQEDQRKSKQGGAPKGEPDVNAAPAQMGI